MKTINPVNSTGGNEVKQFSFWVILWMFAWPAFWYSFLVYVIGPLFIPPGGTTPTWFLLLTICLGGGAELAVGLLMLHREGYKLTPAALRERIRLRWP